MTSTESKQFKKEFESNLSRNQKCAPDARKRESWHKTQQMTKGVFLVTTTIAFVSFERDLSMNTDS